MTCNYDRVCCILKYVECMKQLAFNDVCAGAALSGRRAFNVACAFAGSLKGRIVDTGVYIPYLKKVRTQERQKRTRKQ
jgi:hypothetical protein